MTQSAIIHAKLVSMISKSLENLDIIRPPGVISKKYCGRCKTIDRNEACNTMEAWQEPNNGTISAKYDAISAIKIKQNQAD